MSKIDRRRAGQLEDWERLVDDGLKRPRFEQYIQLYAAYAAAPFTGRIVTQYPDSHQNSNAIFDYAHVAVELRHNRLGRRSGVEPVTRLPWS